MRHTSRLARLCPRQETSGGMLGPPARGFEPPALIAPRFEEADPEVESLGPISRSAEGARRGRKEASEVAFADREEGAGQAQAAKEDLTR
jgi:hypothetical protein